MLANHIGLGHKALFLEHIPHLNGYFVDPAVVRDGIYHTPQAAGAGTALRADALSRFAAKGRGL